ncbi:MAG: outer membrane beta-barrel protein, partial [Bacteroidota bacterium]
MLKIAILCVSSFVSYSIFCQPHHFIGGIFFNANGIHVEGDNKIYWQNSNGKIWGGGGLSAGLSIKHYLHKKYYLNLELRYIQKGSVYEYLNQYATQSFEVLRLNYMELPVSVGYKLKTNKKNHFIESGFAYAKLFSSKVKMNDFAYRTGITNAESFKDYDISWFSSFKFPLNKKGKENLLFG